MTAIFKELGLHINYFSQQSTQEEPLGNLDDMLKELIREYEDD
jgi:hypothetical protein